MAGHAARRLARAAWRHATEGRARNAVRCLFVYAPEAAWMRRRGRPTRAVVPSSGRDPNQSRAPSSGERQPSVRSEGCRVDWGCLAEYPERASATDRSCRLQPKVGRPQWVEAAWKLGRPAISMVVEPLPLRRSSILGRSGRSILREARQRPSFHHLGRKRTGQHRDCSAQQDAGHPSSGVRVLPDSQVPTHAIRRGFAEWPSPGMAVLPDFHVRALRDVCRSFRTRTSTLSARRPGRRPSPPGRRAVVRPARAG